MARKPRLHAPGGLYHVMLRGNGGQAVFFADRDRYHLYLLVQEGIERYGHRIHAFCCMSNHIHFAIQVADVPLAKIMQNLSFRYTRWINQTKRRAGHLFQGRYKSILVDADSYLLELVRYIHLNPVRAKLVKRPEHYRWSGHRAYVGREDLPWLTTQWVLGQFAKRVGTARQRYAQFVREGVGEGYRAEFHRGAKDTRVLGDDKFLNRVLDKPDVPVRRQPSPLSAIMKHVARNYATSERELYGPSRARKLAEARGVVAWLATQEGSATLKAVADQLNRDPSAMTYALRRVSEKARQSRAFQARLQRLMMK